MKKLYAVLFLWMLGNIWWSGHNAKINYDHRQAAFIAAKYGYLAALNDVVPDERLPKPAICVDLKDIDRQARASTVYDRTQVEKYLGPLRSTCK